MTLIVNGQVREAEVSSLAELLETLELADKVVATAVNGHFIRRTDRAATALAEGDKVEILAPMQGG